MNQNLSSYRIFYTVVNTGNISKAAKELYQPACDQQIHPEAGGKRRLQTFFQKFPRRCSDR